MEGLGVLAFNRKSSRLKAWFHKHGMLDKMKTTKCVHHHHKLGFDPQPLKGHIVVTAVEKDHLGIEFVNAFEAIHYPVYGVQFHPEQPENEFSNEVSLLFIEFLKSEM
jgi:anthranilate/para-aminobenzoate synthase component II